MKFFSGILYVATLLLALIGQSEAQRVRVRFTPKRGLAVDLPKGKGYRFDASAKKLYICSYDVVNFYWSGETVGMHMFGGRQFRFNGDQGKADYDACRVNKDINFLKTENPSGSFDTKGNREGWRYYAYIKGLGKFDTSGGEGCKLKLAVYWDPDC